MRATAIYLPYLPFKILSNVQVIRTSHYSMYLNIEVFKFNCNISVTDLEIRLLFLERYTEFVVKC